MASKTMPITIPSQALPFGDPHLHTDGEILALSFATDGTLWSVAESGIVQQWTIPSGKLAFSQQLSDLEMLWSFSAKARLLASASDDLSIWDPRSGKLLTALAQETWVTAMAFHPNLPVIATGHDNGSVHCWDFNQGKLLHKIDHHQDAISALAFSPDGVHLACAGEDKVISLWNPEAGKHLGDLEGWAGHKDRVPAMAWHPSGKILVSAGWDSTARVWNIETMEPVILLNSHATQVWTLAFSPDGNWLACSDSKNQIHIWRFNDKKEAHVLDGGSHSFRHLAFSPDGKHLASGGEGVIRIWDPIKGESLSRAGIELGIHVAMSLSPDGSQLITGNKTGVTIWNSSTGENLKHLQVSTPVNTLCGSPDGKWIAGGSDDSIRIWNMETGTHTATCEGPHEPITCLAFSPDSKTLASGSALGMPVWLWRPEDGEPILLIPDPLLGCTTEALSFHPEGRLLAVAGIDQLATSGSTGAVALWDIVDRCEIATFSGGGKCLAFSPGSGEFLAHGTMDDAICIWNIKNQDLVTDLLGHEDLVEAVQFSPDGRWLVSSSDDLTLRIWDSKTWNEKASWQVESLIKILAFSPDGKFLFTGNGNGICYRWEFATLIEGS